MSALGINEILDRDRVLLNRRSADRGTRGTRGTLYFLWKNSNEMKYKTLRP